MLDTSTSGPSFVGLLLIRVDRTPPVRAQQGHAPPGGPLEVGGIYRARGRARDRTRCSPVCEASVFQPPFWHCFAVSLLPPLAAAADPAATTIAATVSAPMTTST